MAFCPPMYLGKTGQTEFGTTCFPALVFIDFDFEFSSGLLRPEFLEIP